MPAYAKLNLTLDVVGRRSDGLHLIESVLIAIDWHDLVGVTVDPAGVRLRATGPGAGGIPVDGANLAHRAASSLDAGDPGVRLGVWLEKRVPVRAGLGGGSADAAAVLRVGSRLRPAGAAPAVDLGRLAVALGADVPALLAGGAERVSGTGERLEPLPDVDLDFAVVVAGSGETGPAYRALRTSEVGGTPRVEGVVRALSRGERPRDADLGSALEPAACRVNPALAAGLRGLRRLTPGHAWHLTGSGGCAFALTDTALEAEALAAQARSAGFPARACRSVRRWP